MGVEIGRLEVVVLVELEIVVIRLVAVKPSPTELVVVPELDWLDITRTPTRIAA